MNLMGAVLGATLAGIDKSDQDGQNFVQMLQNCYRPHEKSFVGFPDGKTGETYWYEVSPSILFNALTCSYPDVKRYGKNHEGIGGLLGGGREYEYYLFR